MLTPHGFTTPKCRLDTLILTILTHSQPLYLSVSCLSDPVDVLVFCWHVRCGNSEMTTWVCRSEWLFLPLWSVILVGVIMWSTAGSRLSPKLCLLTGQGGTVLWWWEISVGWGNGGGSTCLVNLSFASSCLAVSLWFYWPSQEITLVWLYSECNWIATWTSHWCLKFKQHTSCFSIEWLNIWNMLISAVTAQTQAIVLKSGWCTNTWQICSDR